MSFTTTTTYQTENLEKPEALLDLKPSASVLQVKYNNIWARSGKVLDPTTSQPIYNFEHHYTSPHIVFKTVPDNAEVATATSWCWDVGTNFKIHGQEVKVKPRKLFSSTYTYNSPALGQQASWVLKSGWTTISFVALDENSLPIARFTTEKCFSNMKTLGRIEFSEDRPMDERLRLEMTVIGMTLAYNLMMTRNAGLAAASSSSAAAVVAA